jgi:hypothetical protein
LPTHRFCGGGDFVRLLVTEAQQERDLSLDELLVLNALW